MNISFVYPVANGSLEEVISSDTAITRHKHSQSFSSKPDLVISDEQRLVEFIDCHWATETEKEPGIYIMEFNDSMVPTGSTHLGPYGYVKQKGQFWYIFKEGGWLALSGRPMGALYPLKGES